jgi:hypothetical protein
MTDTLPPLPLSDEQIIAVRKQQSGRYGSGGLEPYADSIAFARAILRAALPAAQPTLAKHQPCGCVICTCEDEEKCHGCGAKHCGTHPVGKIPSPLYAAPVAHPAKPDTFRAILDWRMCSDPWPGGDMQAVDEWLNEQSRDLGYSDWVDAYHTLQSLPASPVAQTLTDGVPVSPATKDDFPYDRTFKAIAAATKAQVKGVAVEVSVEAFIKAWNAYPTRGVQPSDEPLRWEFTGIAGLKRFLTQKQYEAQTPGTQEWYRPICPKCGPAAGVKGPEHG